MSSALGGAAKAIDDEEDDYPKKRKASPPRATTASSFLSMLPAPKNAAGGGLGGGKGALLGGLTTSISAMKKTEEEVERKRAAVAVEERPVPVATQQQQDANDAHEEEYYEEGGEGEEYWGEEEEEQLGEEQGPTMPSYATQAQYTQGAHAQPAYVPYQGFFPTGEGSEELTEVQQVVESLPEEFRRDKKLQQMGVQGKIVDVSQAKLQKDAEQFRKDLAGGAVYGLKSASTPTMQAPAHKLSRKKGQLSFLAYQAQTLENEILQKAAEARKGQGIVKSRYGW